MGDLGNLIVQREEPQASARFINWPSLLLAMHTTQEDMLRLSGMVQEAGAALAASERRAERAEASLAKERTRVASLTTAPADLVTTASALLHRLDTMTTEQFGQGGESTEREALRTVLERLQASAEDQ